jgi:hypothetical protein
MDFHLKYLKYKNKYLELKKNMKYNLNGGAAAAAAAAPAPVDDIRIRLEDGRWVPAKEYQRYAFRQYRDVIEPFAAGVNKEYHYNQYGYKFTIKRIGDKFHGGIYLIRTDGSMAPIVDWNDVKVFLLDMVPVEWYGARNYQTWAYFDFMYSGAAERKYKTIGTAGHADHIEIPIEGLDAGIVFSMSRNPNGTIFYEKDDAGNTRVRISDNEPARRAYYAFYRRMTDDVGMVVVPPFAAAAAAAGGKLPIPADVVVEKTLDDDVMCVVCNDNKQNIQFLPCKHTTVCSVCYLQMVKPRECPMCRGNINQIVKYTI